MNVAPERLRVVRFWSSLIILKLNDLVESADLARPPRVVELGFVVAVSPWLADQACHPAPNPQRTHLVDHRAKLVSSPAA